jgi:heme O synthase-like polyprenyltransferase
MPAIGDHGIVHGLLTTMLALAYAAVVIFLASFLSIVGGGSGLAVAIATLVVAALLWPAWRRIQGVVDRRSNRRRVGAADHR